MDRLDRLQESISAGKPREMCGLLSRFPPNTVNQPLDEDGTTLLHLAANAPDPAILQVLIEYGGDVHVQTSEGYAPLHVASMWGRVEAVRELLDHGADPLVYDEEEMLPLDLAREGGHMECVELLELWPSLHSPPSPDSCHDQTMAETFVSMYLDSTYDLTCDSQLSDEEETLLTCSSKTPSSSESSSGDQSSSSFLEELFTTALDLNLDGCPSPRHLALTPPPSPSSHNLDSTYIKEKPSTPSEDSPPQDTRVTDAVRLAIPPSVQALTNDQLRERLKALGEMPGPVTEHTRGAYMTYLTKVEAGYKPHENRSSKGYRYELALVLSGALPIPDFSRTEPQLFQSLRTPRPNSPIPQSPRARDGMTKTHFNYLLLDPRELHPPHSHHDNLERFENFVAAIFYVGKGKNARSLQHLKEAKDCLRGNAKRKRTEKVKRIIEIWAVGGGVLSLHVFPHTTAQEALTREAAMIDAIGLPLLSNLVVSSYYGEVSSWNSGRRRQLGVYLLHKAMKVYLADPPQGILQNDL